MSTPKSPSDNQIIRALMEASELRRKENIEGFEKLAASIDALAINIAQLTAQQKQTSDNLDKLGEKLDKLAETTERGFDRLTQAIEGHLRLSQAQTENIAALTNLATQMLASKG